MSAVRTPGPWVAIKPEHAPYWGIHRPDSVTVAGTSSGLSEADAAFIVKSCNAHDDLVAALREIRQVADIPGKPMTLHQRVNAISEIATHILRTVQP